MVKESIIEQVYYDPAGYGSIRETLKDAREKDKKISYKDVKDWFAKNVERKTQLSGFNSYVTPNPFDQFQIDLLFFNDLKDPEYNGGLLMVDIFTKYTVVVPIKTKQVDDVLEALKKGFEKMHGKPKTIYSDDEGAFVSNAVQKYFKENNIKHIVTRTHAPYAERQIRTVKEMIYKRVEKTGQRWVELIFPVLSTYNYKMIHNTTHFTPVEAGKKENIEAARENIYAKAVRNRKCPDINVGDHVKIYKKKEKYMKGYVSVWSKIPYQVEKIEESFGQKYYKVAGRERFLLRHEILKLP